MKNNTKTTNPSTSTRRARYVELKTLWRNAPLPAAELEELKTLAKKFNPKMAKYMEENPEMC